jgi:hypothetical protein
MKILKIIIKVYILYNNFSLILLTLLKNLKSMKP